MLPEGSLDFPIAVVRLATGTKTNARGPDTFSVLAGAEKAADKHTYVLALLHPHLLVSPYVRPTARALVCPPAPPTSLLPISMMPSPPLPNLRWLIDSQHARTYVPGNWGIDLANDVAWINQQEGRARTAGL